MKKFPINKKYLEICLYALALVAAVIVVWKIIGDLDSVAAWLGGAWHFIWGLFTPFIIGLFIAYFMNTTVRWFDNVAYRKVKKHRRALSVSTTYVIYIGALVWIIAYLVPQIIESVTRMVDSIPKDTAFYARAYEDIIHGDNWFSDTVRYLNEAFPDALDVNTLLNSAVDPLIKGISSLPNLIGRIVSGTFSMASSLLNFFLGLVVAFYVLCGKEEIAAAIRKLLYTVLKRDRAERLTAFIADSNHIVEKFIIGKAIDSIIIGLIFFVICLILGAPYALLLCLIIGITNMIPYFGPIIGAIPVTLIVMLTKLGKPDWIWILIAIFVLQQFDGMFLGPKILGDSTGLKPMSVIFAIIAGGAVAGVAGMFFGVPVFAVLRNLFVTIMNKRYEKKYTPL